MPCSLVFSQLRRIRFLSCKSSQKMKNKLNYRRMNSDALSFVELLRLQGYDTVGFYTNYFFSGKVGFSQGFSRYESFRGSVDAGAKGAYNLFGGVLAKENRQGSDGC